MAEDQRLIQELDLQPHPEGGWYRQTWIEENAEGRPSGTCIYFLLQEGQKSHWHRVDATEIWHFYAGSELTLSLAETEGGPARDLTLAPRLDEETAPQIIVPKGWWQAAEAKSGWALVGCTVSPGFQFDGFELAPQGFDIPRS